MTAYQGSDVPILVSKDGDRRPGQRAKHNKECEELMVHSASVSLLLPHGFAHKKWVHKEWVEWKVRTVNWRIEEEHHVDILGRNNYFTA